MPGRAGRVRRKKQYENRLVDPAVKLKILYLFAALAPLAGRADPLDDAGIAYQQGDYAKSLALLTPLVAKGSAGAEFALGVMYNNGLGVTQSYQRGNALWHQAANQGFMPAEYYLGLDYSNGVGVPQDFAQAALWWRKAAEQGDALAQYSLGMAYDNGRGVAADPAQAMLWYRKAADQGLPASQYNLGMLYANGEGVAQDPGQAIAVPPRSRIAVATDSDACGSVPLTTSEAPAAASASAKARPRPREDPVTTAARPRRVTASRRDVRSLGSGLRAILFTVVSAARPALYSDPSPQCNCARHRRSSARDF